MYLVLLKPEMGEEGHYHIVKQFDLLGDAQAWIREQFGYFGPGAYAIAEVMP